jgi:hypothetical protein
VASAGRHLFQAGHYDVAESLLALATHVEADVAEIDLRARSELARWKGARARHRGDVAGDLQYYGQALLALDLVGDRRAGANARVSHAFSLIEVGSHERAEPLLLHALAEAERLGLGSVATRARQNLSLVMALKGDLDGARTLARAVIDEARAHGDVRFEGWTSIYRASFDLHAGDCDAAIEAAGRATELLAGTPARAGAQAVLSRALLRANRVSEAVEHANAAMQLLHSFGTLEEFELDVRLAYVEAELARGETARATSALHAAIRRSEELAAALPDEHRSSFLDRVPANRQLFALLEGRGRARDQSFPG